MPVLKNPGVSLANNLVPRDCTNGRSPPLSNHGAQLAFRAFPPGGDPSPPQVEVGAGLSERQSTDRGHQ